MWEDKKDREAPEDIKNIRSVDGTFRGSPCSDTPHPCRPPTSGINIAWELWATVSITLPKNL